MKPMTLFWLLVAALYLFIISPFIKMAMVEGACLQPFITDEQFFDTDGQLELCWQYVDVNCDGEADVLNTWIIDEDGEWKLDEVEAIPHGWSGDYGLFRYVPVQG